MKRNIKGAAVKTEQRTGAKPFWAPKPERSLVQVLPPQPTLRTDLDIGARNPVTTTVTGFFYPIFQVKLNRHPKPKTAFGEDLN